MALQESTAKAKATQSNKFRYYEVTQTFVVKALNATDAKSMVNGKRINGSVLAVDQWVDRLSASAAQQAVADLS